LQSTIALFTADRLRVGPRTLGWIYGFVGVVSVVVQAGIIGRLTIRFGAQSLTRAGALLVAVGMAGIPFAHSMSTLLFTLGLFGVGSALFSPSMSGLVATAAEPHERGSVLGAYQGAASLGRVIGPFAASGVASASSLSMPFLVGAVVSLGGALLIHRRPKTEPSA
jgi:DHA1 family tetracycline resistance protein-like MFS transporter